METFIRIAHDEPGCLLRATGMAWDRDDLLVASQGDGTVKRYDGRTGAYKGDVATASPDAITQIAVHDNRLFVTDFSAGVLRVSDMNGAAEPAPVWTPLPDQSPWGLVFDTEGRAFWSSNANRIHCFDGTGHHDWAGAGGGLDTPVGLTIGPDDLLYAANLYGNSVSVWGTQQPTTGAPVRLITGREMQQPIAVCLLAVDPEPLETLQIGNFVEQPSNTGRDWVPTGETLYNLQAWTAYAGFPDVGIDTEGGDRAKTNLLRAPLEIQLTRRDGTAVRSSAITASSKVETNAIRYSFRPWSGAEVTWSTRLDHDRNLVMDFAITGAAAADLESAELLFAFDPRAMGTSILANHWGDQGAVEAPLIINALDMGQLRLASRGEDERLECLFTGSRHARRVDLAVRVLDARVPQRTIVLSPVHLEKPRDTIADTEWARVRRGLLGLIQLTPYYPAHEYGSGWLGSPGGITGNNVISDPVSCNMDRNLQWLAGMGDKTTIAGIDLNAIARSTIEYWLCNRMNPDGSIDYVLQTGNISADSNTGVLNAATDYYLSTGDLEFVARNRDPLVKAADYLADRDLDGDGLIETFRDGNGKREFGDTGYDTVSSGWKNALVNGQAYKSFLGVARMMSDLGESAPAEDYQNRALSLRRAYNQTFHDPETGLYIWWIGRDGRRHHYRNTLIQANAVLYGIAACLHRDAGVNRGDREIMQTVWDELEAVGYDDTAKGRHVDYIDPAKDDFTGFYWGIPNNLESVPPEHNFAHHGDAEFPYYCNGAIFPQDTVATIMAFARAGMDDRAGTIQREIFRRQHQGIFENGSGFYQGVINQWGMAYSILKWDGTPTCYEGIISRDCSFLQTVVLDDDPARELFAAAAQTDPAPRPATETPETAVLEGRFGRVEIDVRRPAVTTLTLRRPDGTPEPHSILSPKGYPWYRGMPEWGTEAYTFTAAETGERFESRRQPPESVEITHDRVVLNGVMLTDEAGHAAAREDWNLQVDGEEFVWTVDREWLRDVRTTSEGAPALFFSTRPISANPSTVLPNAVATTFWIAPEKLQAWFNPDYRPGYPSTDFGKGTPIGIMRLSLENNAVVTEPGGWAVLKLFTTWANQTEPRLTAERGHLYRRGHFGWLSEVGVVSHADPVGQHRAGERVTTVQRLGAAPADDTGHRLGVEVEDPSRTVEDLCGFYGRLLNGGCINDQYHYNFGNETDGWYYAGASWMKGLPLLVGIPAPGAMATHPHSAMRAFRDNLSMIAATEFEPGLTRFGYNSSGSYTDDNIIQIMGGRAYYLYSGDLAFVRQHLPFYRRAVAWYLDRRNADGLVSLSPYAHWYYDAMLSAGVTTYHNAFLYRALQDLAGLEQAAGNAARAAQLKAEAATLRDAINRVLWWEDAPGGPRYVDWILPDGTRIAYAADLCQFPPLAFGIASPEQARQLVSTIDRRIAELEQDHGYAGYASLSAYWPVPERVNTHPINQVFGSYMNGSSFLSMTYWEIMARYAAGDAEGAWARLKRFAEGTRLTGEFGYIGNNSVLPDGRIGPGAGDEPYLSDAIAVTAALVQGTLGVRHTNAGLEVEPNLPAGLETASVDVVHLGVRSRVTITGRNVTIESRERVYAPPESLVWRLTAGCMPEAAMFIDRTFTSTQGWSATPTVRTSQGQGLSLHRAPDSPLAGLWKLDDTAVDRVANGSEYEADGQWQGNPALQSPDRHGNPKAIGFDGATQAVVGNTEPFTFAPDQSFTLQAWFRTASSVNQVAVARPGAFSLGIKAGHISAWIMQTDGQFVEVIGTTNTADNQWHHAAAVIDRDNQTLTVFLDGQADSSPTPITGIGASANTSPLYLGDFGGGFPFRGTLDEIAIHRAALEPEEFCFETEYETRPRLPLGEQTGTYTSPVCDWGQPAVVQGMGTSVALNDGVVSVVVETSDDNFRTVGGSREIQVGDGDRTEPLKGLEPAQWARLRVTLSTPAGARTSPVVSGVRLTGNP
jgi:glycogen debranching enzyme